MAIIALYRAVAAKDKLCEECQKRIYAAYTRKPQGFRVRGVLVWVEHNGEPHACTLQPAKKPRRTKGESQTSFNF